MFLCSLFSLMACAYSKRRRHTRWICDWSSDVCSSDLLRLARRIEGSFALVKVGDVAGVPVYRDQHEVGVTGADGVIVLNDLRPYQSNRIHVDPNDLPMDAVFEHLQLKLSPALGAGVYADLGVRRVHPMTLRLLGPHGQAVDR